MTKADDLALSGYSNKTTEKVEKKYCSWDKRRLEEI